MIEEMNALAITGTWTLVDLPTGKRPIGYKWVFAVKVNPDGSMANLKAHLVAKGYAQTYGVDYSDTFSSVTKLTSCNKSIMSSLTVDHWAVLEKILCYLKGAPGRSILYENHGHTNIEHLSDVDWTGSNIDRRSTMGYCVFVGRNLVSWKSTRQTVVSRSSAESKYRAMAQSV
ncbi:uncharacterized protein LOC116135226 [Pistacia vera]|uniref:uncharacterized protein LOC116135226 n=1 Tax=Pistacia vera TaxID=55513 RepID=UPI001263C42A|nr:uncharacterized protein LOC116135226 [Pistacia vera]